MRGIALLSLNRTINNLIFGLGGTLLFLGLVISGWGNWTSFFSNPARTGAIILALTGAIAYGFSGSSGLGIGRAEDRSSRWIFIPIIIIAVAFGWLPPHLDRLHLWTIDGNTIPLRWTIHHCDRRIRTRHHRLPAWPSLQQCSSRFSPITD